MKESAVASHIRLSAAQLGVEMWRNNNGSLPDEYGRWIRYGLCNDSKALSNRVKSSDFIGITPIVVTPEMVGQTFGIFTAVETKPSGWHQTSSDKRSAAQSAFHDIVKKAGGFAGFASSIDDFKRIIGK